MKIDELFPMRWEHSSILILSKVIAVSYIIKIFLELLLFCLFAAYVALIYIDTGVAIVRAPVIIYKVNLFVSVLKYIAVDDDGDVNDFDVLMMMMMFVMMMAMLLEV